MNGSRDSRETRPLILAPLPNVFDKALCTGKTAGLWDYYSAGESVQQRQDRYQRAAAICAECPIQVRCRQFARQDSNASGIWGGQLFVGLQDRQPRRMG